MSDIFVSVIIPIYGVEKYIERCARSLFNQTMEDGIEFVFVDDASQDKSIETLKRVIEEYPHRKKQIQIIRHDYNLGLAVARVTGVKAAKGEFVIHCDSDDWVEPEIYEVMYRKVSSANADIAICDFFTEYNGKNAVINQKSYTTPEEYAEASLSFDTLFPYLWIRMVRRSFYLDREFFAYPDISLGEDMAVSIPMHLATNRVVIINVPLYHYNLGNFTSITHIRSLNRIESTVKAMNQIEEYMAQHNQMSILPALNRRRFLNTIHLITCIECYNPRRWLELDNRSVKIALRPRSRLSVFFIRNGMFKVNYVFLKCVRLLFGK